MSVWRCWSVGDEEAYRWTLSTVAVTESLTLSVMDLVVLGVTWSATSVRSVSEDAWMRGEEQKTRTVGEILAVGVRHGH